MRFEDRRSTRAFLPSDLGRPPERRKRPGEIVAQEREDPRRSRTAYYASLLREVAAREASGTLLEGTERTGADAERAAGPEMPASADNPTDPIDAATGRCFNGVFEGEEDAMAQATMSRPVKSKIMKKLKAMKKAKAVKVKGKKAPQVREQTCVNLFTPAKIKLDQKCKKLGKSRNRIINELVAKFVGVKIPARAAS